MANKPHHLPARLALSLGISLWLMTANGFHGEAATTNPPAANPDLQSVILKSIPQEQLAEQRTLYAQAEAAFSARRMDEFQQLTEQLNGYPLQGYLRYKDLHRRMDQLPLADITEFLQAEQGTLVGERLRRDVLRELASRQRWQDFLTFYAPQQDDDGLQCQQLHAMIETGQTEQALQQVPSVWLTGHTLPHACDKVFDVWEKTGALTPELIWQRIALAMDDGRTQLAIQLSKSLDKNDQALVNVWTQVHRYPQQILSSNLVEHPQFGQAAAHAIRRLSAKNIDQAIALWDKIKDRATLNEAANSAVYRHIGLALARKHQPEASVWLNRIPAQFTDKNVREWKVRAAIRQGDWVQIISSVESMPAQEQSELSWQFWWAYAHEQLGNTVEAEGVYQYLAERRDFYGFLAADRLRLPYAFENRPLDVSTEELDRFSQTLGPARAQEFYAQGKHIEARREWMQLTQSADDRQKLIASKLAQLWGWHDRAIITLGKTSYRDDIDLRFPVLMQDTVTAWSERNKIEPALTYAIIRRESAFMADARSPVGAMGLMQLMPSTARNVARQLRVPYSSRDSLLKTDTNIRLGTGYLGQMMRQLDGQHALVAAAYNAGPHRVNAWRPAQPMEAARWIETIPFTETREYVSNVLTYTVIYEHRLGQDYTRLTDRLPMVQPRYPAGSAQASADDDTRS